MEREVDTLLRKGAIEVVPPHERESGFYNQYIIVPKKDGGLHPILDLRQLNRSFSRLKFRMLTIRQNQVWGLVCFDRSIRRIFSYLHPSHSQEVSTQLLICYGPRKRGLHASKQTLSRWIVDAINMSYESSDLPSPMGVKAHSTRSVVASKDFFADVPLQDNNANNCNNAGWSAPLTFVRFYGLDLRANPGSSVLLP